MESFLKKFNSNNYILNKENLKKIYFKDLIKIVSNQIIFSKK